MHRTQAQTGFKLWLSIAATAMLLAGSASAEVMYIVGTIGGNVNGTDVEFGLNIELDMETGEETAEVTNMSPEFGAFMRQVTAMVTIGGPTGGGTPQGGHNLYELSNGNYVNSAIMYWPGTGDRLELIHTVTYTNGDTMQVEATMNGTVPVISADDEVQFADFTETLYWGGECPSCKTLPSTDKAASAQVVTTGVGFDGDFSKAHGFRQYLVGDVPFPGGGGKGSTTTYNGTAPPSPVVRFASDITSVYDAADETMRVHLFNTLTPLEEQQ